MHSNGCRLPQSQFLMQGRLLAPGHSRCATAASEIGWRCLSKGAPAGCLERLMRPPASAPEAAAARGCKCLPEDWGCLRSAPEAGAAAWRGLHLPQVCSGVSRAACLNFACSACAWLRLQICRVASMQLHMAMAAFQVRSHLGLWTAPERSCNDAIQLELSCCR